MRLIKIHKNLLKIILGDFKIKKTFPKRVRFFLTLGKQYCEVILTEYKNLFIILDPVYRKRKQEYDKYNRLKKDLQRAIKLLQLVDNRMKQQGLPRWKIQQFWRDFWKDGKMRADVFENLMKEMK